MDEFGRLQTFIKVVEAGSFSAAAGAGASISSVARQIKSLEDELGVRLLYRSTRSLTPTEPGRLFYARARTITRDLSNAMCEAMAFQENTQGSLRVSLRHSTATTLIVPSLPRFLALHSGLSIDIHLSDERCDFVTDNIDLAIWSGPVTEDDLIALPLSNAKRILCAAPLYLERHRPPLVPQDLRHHQCLLFSAPGYGSQWYFERDGVHEKLEVHGGISSADGLALLGAAMNGLGLIMIPEWMARTAIAQQRLVRVLTEYTVSPRSHEHDRPDLYLVYPASSARSLKIQAFVNFLRQLFGPLKS